MEELERNTGTPIFLGTLKFGTTGELALHLQITIKRVIYKKACLVVLPRHNSSDKRLKA